MSATIKTLTLIALFSLCACVYRAPIQQGNYLDQTDIDRLEQGMTRTQVQFLLGTPVMSDPFHADRWDYLYYVQRGHKRLDRRHLLVYFDGGVVSGFDILDE